MTHHQMKCHFHDPRDALVTGLLNQVHESRALVRDFAQFVHDIEREATNPTLVEDCWRLLGRVPEELRPKPPAADDSYPGGA